MSSVPSSFQDLASYLAASYQDPSFPCRVPPISETAPLFPTSTRSPTIGPLHFEPVAMITVLRQQSLCRLSFSCEIWSSLITEIYEQIMKFYCIFQAATRKYVVSPKILGGGVKKELKDTKRYVPYSQKRC